MSTRDVTSAHAWRAHHLLAGLLCLPLVALLFVDSVVVVAAGRHTWITDDALAVTPATRFASTLTGVGLGLAMFALWWVLHREGRRIRDVGPVARLCWRALSAGVLLMGVGSLVIGPMVRVSGVTGPVRDLSNLLAAAALALTFLPAVGLGLTQLRENRLGIGGRLLSLTVPLGAVTVAVAVLRPSWASPVLLTMSVLLGVSLLGAGRSAPAPR